MGYEQNTDFIKNRIFYFPDFFFEPRQVYRRGGDALFYKTKLGGRTVPRFTVNRGEGRENVPIPQHTGMDPQHFETDP